MNNIVQQITDQLGGGTVGKLSSLLGESPDRTRTAVGAAVPTLLAGLTHVASTPEGAQRVAAAASQQDPAVAGNFANSIPASPSAYNPQGGSNLLTNLFGNSLTGGLTAGLSQFTGVKSGGISNLLGMLGPLVLGMLGRHQRAENLDSSGLANYLNGQKENITAAMPPGLSNTLSRIPGLGGFMSKPAAEPEFTHAGAAPAYTGTTGGGARTLPGRPRVEQPAQTRWLIPILLLAIIAWGLWAWSRHQRTARTGNPPTMNQGVTSTTQFADNLGNTLNDGTSVLSRVTDASTAEQALPQLNQVNDRLTTMKTQMNNLPGNAKANITSSVGPSINKLRDLSAKARNIPGAREKLEPTLSKLDQNLDALSSGQ